MGVLVVISTGKRLLLSKDVYRDIRILVVEIIY